MTEYLSVLELPAGLHDPDRLSTRVLAVNAGSSSLKLSVLDEHDDLVHEARLAPEDGVDAARIASLLEQAPAVDAVGHRIVHGGDGARPWLLADDGVAPRLRRAGRLGLLHQRAALDVMESFRRVLPHVPHVACFDDSFHATLSPAARTYAVPRDWTHRLGMRRHGFHGLSHAYAARRAAELMDRSPAHLRVVVCHLGADASLAAVSAGASVDTTMGLTLNEGLVMATRCGSVDPSALLWIQEETGLTPAAMREQLERDSGLLALSGFSSRMEDVVAAVEAGSSPARLALNVYVHRLRAGVAAMAAAMGGLDALVFTGGVGERSTCVREQTCRRLGFLGVSLDPARNLVRSQDADVSSPASAVSVLVVHAREDLEIAAVTRSALRLSLGVLDGASV